MKFIQGYAAAGLAIDFISVQNEPAFSPPGYPGMLMTSSEQADFIKNHLGPALTNAGLLPKTKILIWDHNWTNVYPHEVLGDAAARAYIAGTAYHCYGGAPDSQTALHDAYPDMGIWLTECSGFTTTTFGDALTYYVITPTIDVARNWGKSVVYWNLALNENQGPQNGGCPNCTGLVTINQSNGTVTYNAGYYALGHLSKFVTPGAYRIDTNTPGHIENVAFKNPDGAKVLLVFNSDATSATFKIRWAGKSFSYTLPAGSAATFKWSGTGGQLSPLPKTNWVATAFSSPTICCQGDTPPKAIDGDGSTRWSSGVAQASANQWFQIDMATARAFNRIVMDAGRSNGDYPRAYQVYVSNDGINWGDSIASGAGSPLTTINFPPQTARYFRILQTGSASNWWSIHELDVYGSALPLTVAKEGNGSGRVASNPAGIDCGGDCTEDYPYGTVVTLTATANAGSSFSGWTGACTGNGVCQVTMDAAKAVTATFAVNQVPLTVAKEGNGSVTSKPPGIDCGNNCTANYPYGTVVTLTATANTGSSFSGWTGACTGNGVCQVTMDAAKGVTATFALNHYPLTVGKEGNGSVASKPPGIDCGNTCIANYLYGTVVTVTATANAGSSFSGWTGACAGNGVCQVTMGTRPKQSPPPLH